ncbi:hypothetical protein KCU65_g9172, partial [Aureobasidium melanogenum]
MELFTVIRYNANAIALDNHNVGCLSWSTDASAHHLAMNYDALALALYLIGLSYIIEIADYPVTSSFYI